MKKGGKVSESPTACIGDATPPKQTDGNHADPKELSCFPGKKEEGSSRSQGLPSPAHVLQLWKCQMLQGNKPISTPSLPL